MRHDIGCAPGDAGKQPLVGRSRADEGIAAVIDRDDDHIDAADERVGCGAQMIGPKYRTVGADHDGRAGRGRQHRVHALAEIAIRLDRNRDARHGRDRLKYRMALIGRGPQRHRADASGSRGLDRAFDQPRLQRGGAVRSERGREARLGKTRQRRLGKDRDRDRFRNAAGHSHRSARASRARRPRRTRGEGATS